MKICNICNDNKPIDQFVKDKTKRGGIRNYCKDCHKEKMKSTRFANPDRCRDIANRSYHKNFQKNREVRRERAKKDYQNNKSMKITLQLERYWSKRELKCIVCNKNLPKHSKRYCDNCRNECYKSKLLAWKSKVGKQYINELQNKRVKMRTEQLTDGYIAGQIRGGKIPGWKLDEIPKHIIDLKRNIIKFKREIKNKIQCQA